jgi:hypothetical protein
VKDTGIGISPDKQEAVFEKFTQADSSITRKYEGSGLGLTISKHLVTLMGGRIWLESREHFGSTFHFVVPFIVQEARSTEASDQCVNTDITGLKVLVVDDNATNRFILRETLHCWGAVVEETNNGADALKILREGRNEPYDLVRWTAGCLRWMALLLLRPYGMTGISRA